METLKIPLWGKTFEFLTAFGHKDNILLSDINQEASLFFKSGLDFSAARLPLDGTQVQFLISGEDTRYFDSASVDKEQLLIAFAQVARDFTPRWRGAFNAQYVYQDQVFDASITETNLATVRPKGQTLRVRPSVRWRFHTNYWAENEFILTRQYFEGALDDFWDGGTKLTLGRSYRYRSEITLSYQFNRRLYDRRLQFTSAGRAVPGTSLEFLQHAAELSGRHSWDAKRRWQTHTRLGYLMNSDNGAGFFDYDKYYVSQQIRFAGQKWETRFQARLSHYTYPVQTVSSVDPSLRSRDDLLFDFRVERKLKEWLKIYGQFEHEQALSNRSFESYDVSTVSAGVVFEF